MIKLNKKGVSMTEMLVSISLISVVLVLLMSLFVSVRTSYNNSKINADYKVIQNEILMAVYQDIEKYGVKGIDATNLSANGKGYVKITFNDYRDDYPQKEISKILKLEAISENTCKISYYYEDSTNLSNTERTENIIKKLPENSTCSLNLYGTKNNLRSLKINIASKKGIDYNVNIWFKVV